MTHFLFILLTCFTVNGVSFEMVPIDGGAFQMGGTIEQRSELGSMDLPVHQVAVSSFLLGQTEVTRRLWKAVMGEDSGDWMVDDLPVEWVSWKQCQEFIQRLDSLTGQHFRLPTEAEWEFAARGGKNAGQQYRYSGGRDYNEVAWLYLNSENRTHQVAQKKPNQLGLYDMSGNVWEWCSDWFAPYSKDTQIDPVGPTESEAKSYNIDEPARKVVRGSSWDNSTLNSRLSAREGRDPEYSFYDCGFRLAMDGDPSQKITALNEKGKQKLKNLKWAKDSTWVKAKMAGQNITLIRVQGAEYLMMESEVTQALWKAVMGKKKAIEASTKGKNLPQNNLTWNDCQDFIYRLDSISGLHFRMPQADEWEYAAHGGSKSIHLVPYNELTKPKTKTATARKVKNMKRAKEAVSMLGTLVGGSLGKMMGDAITVPEDETLQMYNNKQSRDYYTFAGSDTPFEVAWLAASSNGVIHPVCKLLPNELGLYDMSGNVAEWTGTAGDEDGTYLIMGGSFIINVDHGSLEKSKKSLKANQGSEQCGLRLVLDL